MSDLYWLFTVVAVVVLVVVLLRAEIAMDREIDAFEKAVERYEAAVRRARGGSQ